ncbi:MAG: polysaccharide biosynthesis C-terminal domain-containing protein, partial [Methylocapsa sp.]|nr:polysaccharide biosynthesis C-terminal domain-containing protein [Methylocapsa sp.]
GLIAIVLVRSAVASFQAQGDTKTPMMVALLAVAINVALKILLFKPFGAAGLAAATAAGAWINLIALVYLAIRRKAMMIDLFFWKMATVVTVAAFVLSVFALFASAPAQRLASGLGPFANLAGLLLIGIAGAFVYTFVLFAGLQIGGVQLRLRPRRA